MIQYPSLSIDDFHVGQIIEQEFQLNKQQLDDFVKASGDIHPLHTNLEFAESRGHSDVVLHGMFISSKCSAFVASEFIGKYGLLVSMSSDFLQPGYCGNIYVWRAEVKKIIDSKILEISWMVSSNQNIIQRGGATTYIGDNK
jgi:acyl dehydratase